MKKTVNIMLWTLVVLTFLLPCGKLLCHIINCTFEMRFHDILSFILAFLSVGAAAFSHSFKVKIHNKALQIFIAILTPMAFVNTALYIVSEQTPIVIGNCAVYIIASFILTAGIDSPIAIKVISLILSVIMTTPMFWFGVTAWITSDFGETVIVESVDSPDGKYRAEVISSDQGALGGGTFVEVYKKGIDAFVFRITGKPERVYSGDWMAYLNLDIYWKDNNHFVVDSKEYYFK
jgi:hypothetical protein